VTGRWLGALVAGVAVALSIVVPSTAEVVREGNLIVSFGGSVAPPVLPRAGKAPIGVTVSGRVRTANRRLPPSLRRISLEINANGVLDGRGLPVCHAGQLRSASTRQAMAACGGARVGGGRLTGKIALTGQKPFPIDARVIAFNGRNRRGGAEILAHLYSPDPLPLTFLLTFSVRRLGGTYGTRLLAVVPQRTRDTTHVTSFTLHLRRDFVFRGRPRSYLRAGCPAPAGFSGATFPLVRASYGFVGGGEISNVLIRTCHTGP
jgi:hypothetical protein